MGSSCSSAFAGKNVNANKQLRKNSGGNIYKTSNEKSASPNDNTSTTSTKVTLAPSYSQMGTQNSNNNMSSSGSVKGVSSNHQSSTIVSSLSTSTLASAASKKTKKKSTSTGLVIIQPDVFDPVVFAEREIERRQRDPKTTAIRMSLDTFKFPSEKSLTSNQTC